MIPQVKEQAVMGENPGTEMSVLQLTLPADFP